VEDEESRQGDEGEAGEVVPLHGFAETQKENLDVLARMSRFTL
jgi:hypothetical protein